MSALFWLFGLGALAVAFPFLFHLIRRTPKGQTQFSSLMFLKPSPPRLTRRSRLENLLLLLLRMAALILIALAFMRPFLRGTDRLAIDQVHGRRIAILIDTSASMQRGSLWQQAKQQVDELLNELEPQDEVALLTFDESVHSIVPFEENLNMDRQLASKSVRDLLETMQPGWARSDLGLALVTVADQLAVWRDTRRNENQLAGAKLQLVVVSDLQKGSETERLQSYQWPADVFVEFRTVRENTTNNATVQVLQTNEETDEPAGQRVRVRNFEGSKGEQFFVNWLDANQKQAEQPIPFYVPAGTSRVLEVKDERAQSAHEFLLTGDTDEFDNTFFVVPPQQQALQVAYIGTDDPDNPEQMQFYLTRALTDSATRSIKIFTPTESQLLSTQKSSAQSKLSTDPNDEPMVSATLAVITGPVNEQRAQQIEKFRASGGTLLVVLRDAETVISTSRWTSAALSESPAKASTAGSRYAMLAEVDFNHRLFAPFNSPRFNDFTTIRFWNHQRVELADNAGGEDKAENQSKTKIIARFDDNSPAIWVHKPTVGGSVIVFASGWQPGDSQLALSTKFVPILNGILDIAVAQPDFKRSFVVNEVFEFTEDTAARTIIKPDFTTAPIAAGETRFDETNLPGIYRLGAGDAEQSFAVNVDRAESETEPIPIEQLEMFAVNVGRQKTATAEIEQLRELRDRELEDRQKIWKWLIVSAVALLIAETWLAGRTAQGLEHGSSGGNPAVATTGGRAG